MKIFYYEHEFKNLLDIEDAATSNYDELIDYLYDLAYDNISFVGFTINSKVFKVLSNEYDIYILFCYSNDKSEFLKLKELDFNQLKIFIQNLIYINSNILD